MPDEPEVHGCTRCCCSRTPAGRRGIPRRRARAARRKGPLAVGRGVGSKPASGHSHAVPLRRPGPYQLQAAIAACTRSRRPTGGRSPCSTDRLYVLEPSPVMALNRAVAVAMADRPEQGWNSSTPCPASTGTTSARGPRGPAAAAGARRRGDARVRARAGARRARSSAAASGGVSKGFARSREAPFPGVGADADGHADALVESRRAGGALGVDAEPDLSQAAGVQLPGTRDGAGLPPRDLRGAGRRVGAQPRSGSQPAPGTPGSAPGRLVTGRSEDQRDGSKPRAFTW